MGLLEVNGLWVNWGKQFVQFLDNSFQVGNMQFTHLTITTLSFIDIGKIYIGGLNIYEGWRLITEYTTTIALVIICWLPHMKIIPLFGSMVGREL